MTLIYQNNLIVFSLKRKKLCIYGSYISIINICLGKNPGPLCMALAACPVCIEPIKS